MSRRRLPLERALDAFREVTQAPTDGAATRARVLMLAGGKGAWRRLFRRASFVTPAAFVLGSASIAWTIAGVRSNRGAALAIGGESPVVTAPTGSGRPARIIPPLRASLAPPDEPIRWPSLDGEERDYREAHQAHFVESDPAEAVRLWDVYLKAHPSGRFAPEARFNRAVGLIRSERFEEAARALRPIAHGPLGGYRQHDAAVLLDWLAARGLIDGGA